MTKIAGISTDDSKVAVLVVPTDEERMMAREALRALSRSYITRVLEAQKQQPFLVEISAHHIHLTQEHVEALFGKGHQLTKHADLSQPGQYACKEQLTIVGPKGRVERVRILGPARKYTQVEIAMTEQFKLGIHPPIRESGDIADTPGCMLESANGSIQIDRGVICALRHVHMSPEDALRYGVRDKSFVRVRIAGNRELIFGDVLVRVDPSFKLAMHIDTDEGNAANVKTGARGYIDGIQSEGYQAAKNFNPSINSPPGTKAPNQQPTMTTSSAKNDNRSRLPAESLRRISIGAFLIRNAVIGAAQPTERFG